MRRTIVIGLRATGLTLLLTIATLVVVGCGATPAPGTCDPAYRGACVPVPSPGHDVNCGSIDATNFQSVGDDPYDLDSDGDGIACESP